VLSRGDALSPHHGRQGRWRDYAFIERIWKSIKQEEVLLRAYALVHEARTSIGQCLEFYNSAILLSYSPSESAEK
jgi:transposase InsO family protein